MNAHDACGVYVHVPYCRRRCVYCDFYFEVKRPDAAYADAVAFEWQRRKHELHAAPSTLSFGGGTPTAVPVAQLARILEAVRPDMADASLEISLEANPEDLVTQPAADYAAAGFTRMSIGVQSFDAAALHYLSRQHSADDAARVVTAAVAAGLSVGIDLIVGVPGDDDARVQRDIDTARALGVHHISTYVLTLEEQTPLVQLIARGKRDGLNDDAQATAYERAQTLLAEAGYVQYEISNHARPGHESRHNRLYWAQAPFVGLGPGAHSMLRHADGRVTRRHNDASLSTWLSACAEGNDSPHSLDELAPMHALLEGVAFQLRDVGRGVNPHAHALRAGTINDGVLDAIKRVLNQHVQRGNVVWRDDHAHLTPLGARFADAVARDILGLLDAILLYS